MAFFKKNQQKINNLWYPYAITVGKPVDTDQIAARLSQLSTVTPGDSYAVMKNLGSVLPFLSFVFWKFWRLTIRVRLPIIKIRKGADRANG